MSEIFDIKKFKEQATPIIEIPNFSGDGVIKIKAQKPRIMAMAAQGKIPNPLMPMAVKIAKGEMRKKDTEEFKIEDSAQMFEFYCKVCMVEPTYEEIKDYITDDQMMAVFDWAMGGPKELERFRTKQEDSGDNRKG